MTGNDGRHTLYWTRNETESESIVELTLAHRLIGKGMILYGNDATGSVHEIEEWQEDMEKQNEASDTQVVGWNLAAIYAVDKEQSEKFRRELARGSAYWGV